MFKNKEYETLLEAVDASYCDNNIYGYGYSIAILTSRRDMINTILKEMSNEDYYDFEVNRIKTKKDLLKEFEITEL
jgi:hypothetical protein